jgi:alkanesulfonate monooxygenase SsuD/methylene tetrahydromethanopterin reductase-like flavin-dependent oxidoreductase (luciferase family)
VGIRIFTEPQQGASYEQLLALARVAEECRFDAFFRSDHIRKMGSATGLPAYTDAWTTMAGLARDTQRIRLGTMLTPVTLRPIGTFPVVASQVDHMSAGRLEIGLGGGWYVEEHHDYGLPFPGPHERYDLLEDQLAILHGLWSADAGTAFVYKGRTCSVNLRVDSLRPMQRPHPPIILGGRARSRSSGLATRYADEFNCAFVPPELMRQRHDNVRRECEAQGRDPGSLVWSVSLVVCCGRSESEVARRAAAIGREVAELREHGVAGSPEEVVDKLAIYAAAGAERFYLQVLDVDDHDHLRLLGSEVQPFTQGR